MGRRGKARGGGIGGRPGGRGIKDGVGSAGEGGGGGLIAGGAKGGAGEAPGIGLLDAGDCRSEIDMEVVGGEAGGDPTGVAGVGNEGGCCGGVVVCSGAGMEMGEAVVAGAREDGGAGSNCAGVRGKVLAGDGEEGGAVAGVAPAAGCLLEVGGKVEDGEGRAFDRVRPVGAGGGGGSVGGGRRGGGGLLNAGKGPAVGGVQVVTGGVVEAGGDAGAGGGRLVGRGGSAAGDAPAIGGGAGVLGGGRRRGGPSETAGKGSRTADGTVSGTDQCAPGTGSVFSAAWRDILRGAPVPGAKAGVLYRLRRR